MPTDPRRSQVPTGATRSAASLRSRVALPTSFRLSSDLLGRLDEEAGRTGSTGTALVSGLLDEGLEMRRFPGIVYRDGAAGRRAGLPGGPDVWELVRAVKGSGADGQGRLREVADELDIPLERLSLAIDFGPDAGGAAGSVRGARLSPSVHSRPNGIAPLGYPAGDSHSVSTGPRSRPRRYAELTAGELAERVLPPPRRPSSRALASPDLPSNRKTTRSSPLGPAIGARDLLTGVTDTGAVPYRQHAGRRAQRESRSPDADHGGGGGLPRDHGQAPSSARVRPRARPVQGRRAQPVRRRGPRRMARRSQGGRGPTVGARRRQSWRARP